MADITIAWDPTDNRGDWVLNPPTINQQSIAASSPQQFAVGDGVTSQFALAYSNSAISNVVAQIFRNDWQGNQLLYATARTNLAIQSQAFDNAAWVKLNATVMPNAVVAPDGTQTADLLYDNTTSGEHRVTQTANGDLTQTWSGIVFVQSGSGSLGMLLGLYDTGNFSNFVRCVFTNSGGAFIASTPSVGGTAASASVRCVALANGWYMIGVQGVVNSGLTSGTVRFNVDLFGSAATGSGIYVGTGSAYNAIWGGDVKQGILSSYIPTTTAAVTVTDYTLASNGLVTLSTAPVQGAVMMWAGSYTLNVFEQGGYLQTGNDLQTAILISIFSDRMAQPGDVIPDGTNDPRGWWADDEVPIGSRMWLLKRAKQTTQTLQRAYDYIAESLQWLVDDGVVARFDITVQWVRASTLGASIIAYSPTGTILSTGQYSWAWAGIN